MTQPFAALFASGLLKTTLFPQNSRYFNVDTAVLTTPGGTEIAYLKRRFLPQSSSLAVIGTHTVTEGERLDHIAASALGDPEVYWRLCDANDAMNPSELEEPGLNLNITLPAGLPGQGR